MKSPLLTRALSLAGFVVVTLVAYSFWAFRIPWIQSELALYLTCTVVFFTLGSLSLFPLVRERVSFRKFFPVFCAAIVAYALLWCLLWMSLHNKTGELAGSFLGLAAMTFIFRYTLGRPRNWWLAILLLYLTHSAGYHLGEFVYKNWSHSHTALARLGWGLFHGLGFGAGLVITLSPPRAQAEA